MSQSQQQQQPIMDADTMLDVYILDYLSKRKFNASTKAFEDEAKVPINIRAIDAPRGFLFEWWTVFWDTFISRYKRHQGSVEPSNEGIRVPQQHQQGGQHQSQSINANNAITGKNLWIADALTPMKQPLPKQWYGDNVGIVMNPINSMNHLPIEHQKHALVPVHDINSLASSLIHPSAQAPEGLLSGAHATGALTNLPLKGWPLTGLDQIQTRLQQQQGIMVQPSQSSYHRQMEGQLQPPMERKRKQMLMSPGVANSSGTANAVGVFSSSTGEMVSLPNSPLNDKINIDDFLNYGALDGNDNSLLSHASTEHDVDASNGFTFLEVGSVQATSVNCCQISSDGKLVAIGGQDKKASLWCTSSRETKATFDGHTQAITDIRFSPSMLRIATSSLDKTVRIWDIENPGCAVRTFTGHTASVTSIDFHPKREELICSCDENEIRYWAIKNAGCVKVAKGGANLVRFQSGVAKHIAVVVGKSVSISDLDISLARRHVLKGHASNVQSICWDSSGERLISVSEDSVKVWRVDSVGKANCIHELSVTGKRFRCGIFHPCYPSLLIIGCYQSMELWNMTENKMMMPIEEPVTALAVSTTSGLIASAGHNDNVVKLWK
ncbi:hypothetical protein L6452_21706 [Arctium lappa]|uniref:Uncharacterized protein n=1 Tax=Arctium lappa TaxID=4217 RepID=A0ACB9AY20_ARCLA|nr:hypothetical protein L6452_21706 [Arctium lappa]